MIGGGHDADDSGLSRYPPAVAQFRTAVSRARRRGSSGAVDRQDRRCAGYALCVHADRRTFVGVTSMWNRATGRVWPGCSATTVTAWLGDSGGHIPAYLVDRPVH